MYSRLSRPRTLAIRRQNPRVSRRSISKGGCARDHLLCLTPRSLFPSLPTLPFRLPNHVCAARLLPSVPSPSLASSPLRSLAFFAFSLRLSATSPTTSPP